MSRSNAWLRLAVLATAPALAAACGGGAGQALVEGDGGGDARAGERPDANTQGEAAPMGADAGVGLDAGEGVDTSVGLDAQTGRDSTGIDDAHDASDARVLRDGGPACLGVDAGASGPRFAPPVAVAKVSRAMCNEGWCPPGVLGLTVADFNGDGKDDLAYLADTVVEVLLAKGAGRFEAPVGTVVAPTLSAYDLHVGDFDGDGRPDLLLETITARDHSKRGSYECTASALTVLLGHGDGTFDVGKPVVEPVSCTVFGVAIADLDGDGRSDVVLAGGSYRNVQGLAFGPAQVAVMMSKGGSLVQKLDRTDYSSYLVANEAVAGDFNGDGVVDFATETYGGIFLSLGKGQGAFEKATVVASIQSESLDTALTESLYAADVNGDGYDDLVSSSYYAAHVRLGGPKSLGAPVAYPEGASRITAIRDFDGDGHLDVLGGQGPLTLLQGRGDGTFEARSVEVVTRETYFSGYAGGIVSGDFDGDGLPDLAASGTAGKSEFLVEVLMNGGCGSGGVSPQCEACAGTCTPEGCLQELAHAGPPAGSTGEVGTQIVVDAKNVYWTSADGVFQVPVGGGATTTIATGRAGGLTVDGSNVYFTTYDKVLSVPIGGGTATTLASMQPGAMGVAVDASRVYWTNGYWKGSTLTGEVMSAPLGGGTATTFAASQEWPTGIAVTGNKVYWANTGCYGNTGTVVMQDTAGGQPTTLYTGATGNCEGGMFGLVVDGSNVYASPYGGAVVQIPLGGGAVTTLVKGTTSGGAMAVGGTSVYYAANTLYGSGTVQHVPVGGGGSTSINAGLAPAGFWGGVGADSTSVYWTTGHDSVLMKLTPR